MYLSRYSVHSPCYSDSRLLGAWHCDPFLKMPQAEAALPRKRDSSSTEALWLPEHFVIKQLRRHMLLTLITFKF